MSGLDSLLAVLKSPELATDLSARPELWAEIKRLAEVHRFSGWLAHSASPWLSPSERPWRDQTLMMHHRRHAQRLAALRRLIEAFREEGISCVSLKGPLLAERFYERPYLRPANDLDLLIHERDVGRSARVMSQLGFQLEGRHPWQLHRKLDKHLDFHPAGNLPRVEIHFRLKAGGAFLPAAEFLDRACTWPSPSGFEALVLSPSDDAFYSCVHAANHVFHRLRWLYDTICIARSLTSVECSRVRQLAIIHKQVGRFVGAEFAAGEFFGESLAFDNTGFSIPWLWSRLAARHTRNMVERVEGTTSTFFEKVGSRLDTYRMAGSPIAAAQLFAGQAEVELQKKWYALRHPPDPDTLARTLPT